MVWLVPGSRDFLRPGTFGVDAGRLYGVLPDRSASQIAARPRNPQSRHKAATPLIQVAVVYLWCSRHPQPGYQTSPIQVVTVFFLYAACWSLWLKPGNSAVEVWSEGHTWSAFMSIHASTASHEPVQEQPSNVACSS